MPWRPKVFKSKEDRKKRGGESSVGERRSESRRSDAQRDAQGHEPSRRFIPFQHATFEAHPGTPWPPVQEDPTSTSSVGPRGSILSIRGFDDPSHKKLNSFVQEDSRLRDGEHQNAVGVQSSDEEDEPVRPTSSRSRTETTKRSKWQAARRRVLGRRTPGEREDDQSSWEAREISFKNPWMQKREGGHDESGQR
ncbi:hypothetical protein JCM10296v2_002335 [Rhodotorula toruloides]